MEEILEQLRVKFYYTSQKFGGPEAMLQQLSLTNDEWSTNYKVSRLLSHPGPIRVVSPWDINFLMPGLKEGDSIVTSHPYQVHDMDGRLIYKVSSSSSSWGTSTLDKLLVLQSQTGEFFYLSYKTFLDTQRVLLIINNLAIRSSQPISDDDFIRVPAAQDQHVSNNHIKLDCSSLNINPFLVTTYFLKSVAHRPPAISYITSNPLTKREDYYLTQDDSSFLFLPRESGWLHLSSNSHLLGLQDLIGVGDDRLIEVSPSLYYLAVGAEMDTNILRQSMGVFSRRPPGFSRDDVIKLSAQVVKI
jgi:hypothetical protein